MKAFSRFKKLNVWFVSFRSLMHSLPRVTYFIGLLKEIKFWYLRSEYTYLLYDIMTAKKEI